MNEELKTNKGFKKFWKLAIFYLLFVVINIGLNRLCGLLHLPLFLDNVGTLLAAALGGYLPGIIVGYSSNIFNSAFDPANAYYAVLSVLIAVVEDSFMTKDFLTSSIRQ